MTLEYKEEPLAEGPDRISRAQGCLLGQLAGDALGSLVEFRSSGDIRAHYPGGVRELANGGTWNTIAGQPTDDSEMALMLARMLAEEKRYDAAKARDAYIYWLDSFPFDCGMTVSSALRGTPMPESQANGAMMRVSPLGIFGANYDLEMVRDWAMADAAITHCHPLCQQANALFAMAIAKAVRTRYDPADLYGFIVGWGVKMGIDKTLLAAVRGAAHGPPEDFFTKQGWVLIAFRNALWQLLHAANTEEAIVDTVMRGGDTDTNAAICGALLGAVHGRQSIPQRWIDVLLECRPENGNQRVRRPRPECFWPIDALELAERLVRGPTGS